MAGRAGSRLVLQVCGVWSDQTRPGEEAAELKNNSALLLFFGNALQRHLGISPRPVDLQLYAVTRNRPCVINGVVLEVRLERNLVAVHFSICNRIFPVWRFDRSRQLASFGFEVEGEGEVAVRP